MKTVLLILISTYLLADNSLIIYNDNLGLVHEQKKIKVKKSDKEITYEGVANTIETASVNVKLPKSIQLYSQQYRFDKLTLDKLLDAHIQKAVKVRILKDVNSFKEIEATLLSHNANRAIVQTKKDGIITVFNEAIIFKTVPDALITKPSLVWNISASKNIEANMEIDYLIKSISWQSNYVLNVTKERADLSGWITINNASGKKFEETQLHLLAGSINRANHEQMIYRQSKEMLMSAPNDVATQAHEGYHFYTIPFKVNLANNEETQIKFIDIKNLPITREYTALLSNPLYLQAETEHNVVQYIKLKGLDIPIPKGVVRSYSKLQQTSILLGESSLNHTPKNKPISLKIGQNFDLQVKESTLQRNDTKKRYDATINYSVTNSSDEPKSIELLVPFNRDVKSDIDTKKAYKITQGNLLSFIVKVKANSSESFNVKFKTQNR